MTVKPSGPTRISLPMGLMFGKSTSASSEPRTATRDLWTTSEAVKVRPSLGRYTDMTMGHLSFMPMTIALSLLTFRYLTSTGLKGLT